VSQCLPQAGRFNLNVGGNVPSPSTNELTAAEHKILEILISHAGSVVSREELVRVALGRSFSPESRTLDVHVHRIRRKLQSQHPGQDCIKTVRGAGYIYTVAEAAPLSHSSLGAQLATTP
jgi:DNA-binding response OmpR family regulator